MMPKFEVYVETGAALQVSELTERKHDRKALGCLNNALPDSNINIKPQNTHTQCFPQKQHKKKHEALLLENSYNNSNKSSTTTTTTVAQEDFALAAGYEGFVLENMRMRERRHQIRGNYMSKQNELTHNMRSVLIDWLVDVSVEFRCVPEVVFVSVNYLDRFLSVMAVTKCRLQLLGITCLSIALKYEDANSRPHLKDLLYFTNNSCTYEEVVTMECLVVRTLDFELNTATPMHFLCAFLQQSPLPATSLQAAKYLLEYSLLDQACSMKHHPSILAASVLFLARTHLTNNPWNASLSELTGYGVESLEGTVKELMRLERHLPLADLLSVQRKYANLLPTSQS